MKLILELKFWDDECEVAQYHGFEGEKDEAAALIEENVARLKSEWDFYHQEREKIIEEKKLSWKEQLLRGSQIPRPAFTFDFYGHQLNWRNFGPYSEKLRFELFTLDEFFEKIL